MEKRTHVVFFVAALFGCMAFFSVDNCALCGEVDPASAAPTNENSQLQETNPPAAAADRDVIQQAIEQLRRETEPAFKQPAESSTLASSVAAPDKTEVLEERLRLLERALQVQHQTELEAVHSSNRTVLLVVAVLAGAVLAGILSAVLVLTKTINRLSAATARLAFGGEWPHGPALPALPAGEFPSGTFSQSEQVNSWFDGAIERLEKRIREMEQTTEPRPLGALEGHLPVSPPNQGGPRYASEAIDTEREPGLGLLEHEPARGRARGSSGGADENDGRMSLLIGKGQALLNLGQAEEALRCFDQAAALDPANAETHVKRGMALEKLQKMEEALDSYNLAIAADGSMALAYLYKGAVCNRLQRYREALDCYEKALSIEPKSVAS